MKIIENYKIIEDEVEREFLFKKLAMDAIVELNLKKFINNGLEFARSEKEIAKCQKIKEKNEKLIVKDIENSNKNNKAHIKSKSKNNKKLQVREKFNKFKKKKFNKNIKK